MLVSVLEIASVRGKCRCKQQRR